MTVLSRKAIRDEILRQKLVVTPILDPKKQIGNMSIDLRMGTSAALIRGSDLSHVDPALYMARDGFPGEKGRRRKLERMSVPFGDRLTLHAGSLILVSTLEWVSLPPYLKGVVTARSSWAREGLNIATATFIDPCYNGIVTLELANLSQVPVVLYPGMRIAQIAFMHLEGVDRKQECLGNVGDRKFNLSFEPNSGDITKDDEPFIPPISDRAAPVGLERRASRKGK